jgi:SAM-dependent methyltransferase
MSVEASSANRVSSIAKPASPERPTFDGSVSPAVERLGKRFYPDFHPDVFGDVLKQKVRSMDRVLEIGAGSGHGNQAHFELRGHVAFYAGIDPDPRVVENQYLDDARVGNAESIPFENESFDLVFHSFVAEHFQSPLPCNREIARVLKPGGRLIFLTPSRYFYATLAAQITPHSFHEFYISHFGSGRSSAEVFPTYYRLNSERSIRKQMRSSGLECEIQHISIPPGYLRFNTLAFLCGILFERTFEKTFPALRARLLVDARKTI